MRDGEQQALTRIGEAYDRHLQAGEQLERLVDEASAAGASPPIDALRADFDAQLEVTRAVSAFAADCPPEGPDLHQVPGAAFVLAMYQAGGAVVAEELDRLARAFDVWLTEVSQWTPAHVTMPPTRPASEAHSHALATVGQWWEFQRERLHDDVVAMLATATGKEGVTVVGVGAEGELIKVTCFDLRTAARASRRSGIARRIAQWLRAFRR